MIKPTIQVTIIDDSRQETCEVECGVDWSAPETIALAEQQIKNRFGDEIQLDYFDLSKATPSRDILEWSQKIKKESLSLPLLILNGQLRISGYFDIRQLIDAIEAEMEMGV